MLRGYDIWWFVWARVVALSMWVCVVLVCNMASHVGILLGVNSPLRVSLFGNGIGVIDGLYAIGYVSQYDEMFSWNLM